MEENFVLDYVNDHNKEILEMYAHTYIQIYVCIYYTYN